MAYWEKGCKKENIKTKNVPHWAHFLITILFCSCLNIFVIMQTILFAVLSKWGNKLLLTLVARFNLAMFSTNFKFT